MADGTPYVGALAVLAYDRDEDRVQCHLCGEWFRLLGSSHLRRTHGWTLGEYREAFHLPVKVATCSRDLSAQQCARAIGLIARGGGFGQGVGVAVAQRAAGVARWRSLAARPDLIAELAIERNPAIGDLAEVAAKSTRKLWWRCGRCGHEWQAAVGSRAAGSGCPQCDRQRKRRPRAVAWERSLQARYPALAAEWHPSRNRGIDPAAISPGSKQRAWWQCARCGHEWHPAIDNRARGSGCPRCGLVRRARTQSLVHPARSLAVRHPELAAELHRTRNPGIDPARLGARSGLKLWWQCARCGHEWQTAVATRTGGCGCPACYLTSRRGTGSAPATGD